MYRPALRLAQLSTRRALFSHPALSRAGRAFTTSPLIRKDDPSIPRPLPNTVPQTPGVAEHWNHPTVTYEQVKAYSQQPSEKILLIDVREPEEIAQGSIPSSVALPLSQLPSALSLSPNAFQQKFGFPLPPRTGDAAEGDGAEAKEVVFYCRSGKRSLTACDLARGAGWRGVRNYDGSWLDWTKREQEKGQ